MTAVRLCRALRGLASAAAFLSSAAACPAAAATPFTLFETGQVRPLALSPDGARLFAVNTPDNRLEIFTVGAGGLTHAGSVPVGLEPLAVAARTNGEVWVVNHLSDSVSIVDATNPAAARVVRTLLVGDEPRDIVFGGPLVGGAFKRAFVTTAHRGQNTPFAGVMGETSGVYAQLTTPGVGRADVWVFDNLDTTLGGTVPTILTFFGDTPRALAVTPDGSTVYAAVFHSGNRTTALSEGVVCNGGAAASPCGFCAGGVNAGLPCTANGQCPSSTCPILFPGGLPAPNTDHTLEAQPETGLVVKFDGTNWVDELGRSWNNAVRFSLPDKDVFAINALATPPVESAFYQGVGTILFNMVVNPADPSKVYVANTEAFNDVRFEGPGAFAASFKPPGEPATVRGHLAESRITILDGSAVTPRHLNKHVDYDSCCAPNPNTENANSIAFPLGMAVSSDGGTLYVAGFGSSEVGVYDTTELEDNGFVPNAADQLPVSGGGPTGLVLDETHSRLYVLTRFDNSISVVRTAGSECVGGSNTGAPCTAASECPGGACAMETAHLPLHNSEPASVVNGRPFNYDASFTSSHGDSACASCHVFADFDSLAWDLGDPDTETLNNPGPFAIPNFIDPDFHALKGPMTTQSLRGLANHGPMHWRGDRTGGNDEPNLQPDGGTFDEDLAFKKFNVAFEGLLGRSAQLEPSEMQAYTDFILQITYPPNPIRTLDNSLTFDQQQGRNFFFGPISDSLQDCDGCHRLAPGANPGGSAPGFFGTDGQYSFENEPQVFKIPHLRNMYQKVGMFGMPAVPFFNPGNNDPTGPQVRGFGFLHDGSVDTLLRFHNALVFNNNQPNNAGAFAVGPAGDPLRRQVEAFMLAFDSNLAPIVGQQITRSGNDAAVDTRIDLLIARADAGECDLVVKFRLGGEARGALYAGSDTFVFDDVDEAPIADADLRALANTPPNPPGQELTYTCVPPGSGARIGLDRDGDSFADHDEVQAGSDPADPESTPSSGGGVCSTLTPIVFKRAAFKDGRGRLSLVAKDLPLPSYTQETISILAVDGDGTIFTGNVPGAAIVPKGSGFKFVAPSGSTGITRVTVKRSKSTGLFKVTGKTKEAWTPPKADETELTTEVTLNVGGRCFRGNATRVRP